MLLFKKLLPTFILFFSAPLFAQDEQFVMHVDYPAIDSLTHDSLSDYYYPKIFKRYTDHDTTLTVVDYHYLYYGYTFQDAYNSLLKYDKDSFQLIFDKEKLTEEDFKDVIKIAVDWLEIFPFDIEAVYLVAITHDQLGDMAELDIWARKFSGLMDAIMASGDGLAVETALYVIRVPDEYFVLEMLGFDFAGSQSLVYPCDYLEVEPNEYDIEGLFFNVAPHFAYLKRMLKGKD